MAALRADLGLRVWGVECRVRGLGLGAWVWGLGFGVWGLGFGIRGSGFGVWDRGLVFGVWCFGLRFSGFKFGVSGARLAGVGLVSFPLAAVVRERAARVARGRRALLLLHRPVVHVVQRVVLLTKKNKDFKDSE